MVDMKLFKRPKSIINKSSDRSADPPTASSSSSKSSSSHANSSVKHPVHPVSEGVSPLDYSSSGSSSRGYMEGRSAHRSVHDPNHPNHILDQYSGTSSLSAKSIYTNYPEMYAHNDLKNFSFGAAPSIHPSSSSIQGVEPLHRARDDANSTNSDDISQIPDTTPRPSVVGNTSSRSHRPHSPLSRPNQPDRGPKVLQKRRELDSDSASNFGTSSASASVSSLAQSRQPSRGTSHISGSTETSSNDLTSDEEADGRHPFPPDAFIPRPRRMRNRDQESSLYLSEEDFENDNDEADFDVNDGRSAHTPYYGYSTSSGEGHGVDPTERRGSLARDIPGSQSDRSFMEHRPKDHFARRASRSLEDLASFSFATASNPSHSGRDTGERPLPLAPTSMPESEGDWRDLRKKSIQRDKELPHIFNPTETISSTGSATAAGSGLDTSSSTAIPSNTSSSNDITQWISFGVNGVIDFDPSEMADLVSGVQNGERQSFSAFRKGSSSTFRRQSTVSSVDIFTKRVAVWSDFKHKSQRALWVFTREKLDADHANRGDRERSSIVALFSSRPSTSSGAESGTPVSRSISNKSEAKEKEKSKEKGSGKDKPTKEIWRGMALDAEEIWSNGALGTFKVVRRNSNSVEPRKPNPQRLFISLIRPFPYNPTAPEEGPAVTIHKHSKAAAFSISRSYRVRSPPRLQDVPFRGTVTTSSLTTHTEVDRKKSNSMILLAPRLVQRAYTSTNTTRKLESHGLLNESGHTSDRDIERMRREHGREERLRAMEKRKERKDKGSGKEKDKGKEPERDILRRMVAESSSKKVFGSKSDVKSEGFAVPELPPLPDSSEGSSSLVSVANATLSVDSNILEKNKKSPLMTETTFVASVGSTGSVDPSSSQHSHETISGRTVIQRPVRSHPRKRGVYDIDDDDDEDDFLDDGRPRYLTRTPHTETYNSLPAEVFENVQQDTPAHGIFGWKSRSDRSGHRINPYLEASYNPPWPTTAPRANSETRKFIVDDLNMSFQDVGLLPATGEIKGSSHSSQHKRRHRDHRDAKQARHPTEQQDIFRHVPDDSLYMLLPLWPGETDPTSTRNHPFDVPFIPVERRLYLMVYYKTLPKAAPVPSGKTKSGEKKRSRESPTQSVDHDRAVLLPNFHMSARIVTYAELQGTGVRIPDRGLSVSGRMEDAWASIPPIPSGGSSDIVLGQCHSRDNGVEFYSEGFDKLGLTTHIPNPNPPEPEDDDSQSSEFIPILTPIGRAAMEMAWLGGLAVNSFNPNL